ncbi:unnamed protein product [Meloidogyne enterolobii]|uniref:Uncharacterized protein n=1 Tax=Meloidogyne enterolobii TaxID=390850 RepID=A0ACB0XWC5_MELEN
MCNCLTVQMDHCARVGAPEIIYSFKVYFFLLVLSQTNCHSRFTFTFIQIIIYFLTTHTYIYIFFTFICWLTIPSSFP